MRDIQMLRRLAGAACLTLALGCGGEAGEESAAGGSSSEPSEASAVELGELDLELAAQGEALLREKGCTACHQIGGGRLVGPDLAGVTRRRSRAFIVGMIVSPDSMLANDAAAKQMLGEYFTPMSNQGVTREDALALFEYFRSVDEQ